MPRSSTPSSRGDGERAGEILRAELDQTVALLASPPGGC
jgi:hypothetical protein